MTFLVLDHKFRISSLFRGENYYFPLLLKMSPCFRKIHLLFSYFMCASFPPYFDHDAFLHHPIYVLDAPAYMYVAARVGVEPTTLRLKFSVSTKAPPRPTIIIIIIIIILLLLLLVFALRYFIPPGT